MVGVSDLLWAYQQSGPALLLLLLAGAAYAWQHDIRPRLEQIEQQQEKRGDRWEQQQLNAQERALLIDDAQERVDQVENAITRLKTRVRDIEQEYAADHGRVPGDPDPEDGPFRDETRGGDD